MKDPRHVILLRRVDSTSAYIKRRRRFLRDRTFVTARSQTAGHGRRGRSWESAPGQNLLFSVYLEDETLVKQFERLSLFSALAVIRVLSEYSVENLSLKWPNDVYADGRKICGILLEGITEDEKLKSVVIGIGVNVNQSVFGPDKRREPTSVFLETGKKAKLGRIRRRAFCELLQIFEEIKKGDDSLIKEAQSLDFLSGKDVLAEIGGETREVQVVGIEPDCTLRVNCDGQETRLNSGEISFHI